MKKNHFAVIGGDYRSVAVAKRLSALGFFVQVFGFNREIDFPDGIKLTQTLKEACESADVIILPLPCSTNGKFINTPLFDGSLSLSSLCDVLCDKQMVFGGKLDSVLLATLTSKNIPCLDYTEPEEFSVRNAIPTAEGALQLAMEELPYTINKSNCLVAGFGRIGKVLSHFLHGLGAHVTVSARKKSDLAWVESLGYTPLDNKQIKEQAENFQLVFNTVPFCLFDRENLSHLPKGALIIDLASRPGGVDVSSAEKLGIKVIHALSLPGKVAPHTAGNIIATTVLNLISEQEVKA